MKLSFIPNLQSTSGKGWYTLTFPYNQADVQLAKQCGFRWNPGDASLPYLPPRVWWTTDLQVAAKLIRFADEACRLHMQAVMRNEARGNVELKLGQDSRKQRIFRVFCPAQMSYIPAGAGFRWHPKGQCYVAKHIWGALMLKEYADEACLAVLAEFEAQLAAREALSRKTDSDLAIPVNPGCEYYPFQRAGIEYAMSRDAVLIGDEMGLGKTPQAIGVINCTPSASKILIVCPASLKLNWRTELRKWLINTSLFIGIADGGYWPRAHGILDTGQIVIVNYDILHKHRSQIANEDWDILIADEVHLAKNKQTRRAQHLYEISAGKRVFLTGTPIANRARELYALLEYLDPQMWGNRNLYMRVFCGATGETGSNLEFLQRLLRGTLMIRRLKAEVLKDLPPKRRQIIELPASAAVKQAEDAVLRDMSSVLEQIKLRMWSAPLTKTSGEFAETAMDLKAYGFDDVAVIARVRHETALSKVPAAVKFLEEAVEGSGKVVCFAHHKDVIAGIEAAFGKRCVKLVGDMGITARQESVNRFQSDPTCQLFIGSIQAAGVGITLTAASHVIFVEEDWVPGNMSQAEDRLHRIGQRDSVLVQHLVLEGSLDAYMVHTIVAKQELIEQALDRRAEAVSA